MPSGYGYRRGGWGFGFRGSSPPWPYVGRGRGGLPRCAHFFSGAAGIPVPPVHPAYAGPWSMPYYAEPGYPDAIPFGYEGPPTGAVPGAYPYAREMTREQELDYLKGQAEAIKGQLEQIDARIKELETE